MPNLCKSPQFQHNNTTEIIKFLGFSTYSQRFPPLRSILLLEIITSRLSKPKQKKKKEYKVWKWKKNTEQIKSENCISFIRLLVFILLWRKYCVYLLSVMRRSVLHIQQTIFLERTSLSFPLSVRNFFPLEINAWEKMPDHRILNQNFRQM